LTQRSLLLHCAAAAWFTETGLHLPFTLVGIGLDCLSDAVLQAFNETQPGMMGFSEDTVRQLM